MDTFLSLRLHSALLGFSVAIVASSLMLGCATGHNIAPEPEPIAHRAQTSSDLRIAASALEAGDTQLAISVFEKMINADPKSTVAQLGLGDAMYQAGELDRAQVLYTQVAASVPDDPRPQLGLARVALRERRLDQALARYRKLIAANPDNALAAEGLGAALDLQGKHTQAQLVYRAALTRHPEVRGLKANLGLSLILANKPREGANVLLDITPLPDTPPQARGDLALAYGLMGNTEAAKQILLADLPAECVEDDLRFYQNLRKRLIEDRGENLRQGKTISNADATPRGWGP